MVEHNVSPETVLCRCCNNRVVPEANYNICEKRRGLIPETLAPLLKRRKRYKQLMRASISEGERARYAARQTAIKWMLVSCFGYLGYKNARFGRIEAHEAVTAFGREKLLRAKEIAESLGYRVLHALTDSLWLTHDEMNQSGVLALCDEITRAAQIEMSLEGIYRWIVFLPSKQNGGRPVACRYYGVFADGRLKLRGLACRRSDTPPFIKDVQRELLAILAQAATRNDRLRLIEEAERVLYERIHELEEGRVDPQRLLLKRRMTRELDAYQTETRTATAARQLDRLGVKVHPGERVRYVVADARAKTRANRVRAEGAGSLSRYDSAEYIRLLKAAAAEVLFR
jgi:DNA polymerase elongation subunit (family B)